jgi:hypothetical protein
MTIEVPTLQTVLERLCQTGLRAKAVREAESAIHVFCRELGRRPDEVPVQHIEQLGQGLNAARMGVTQGRVNNIKSLVRRAVAATVAEPARRRLDTHLNPTWTALVQLGRDQGDRIVLKRLFRIFQENGIEPGALTTGAFDGVRGYLRATGASRPDASYRKMVIAWNRLNTLLRSSPI